MDQGALPADRRPTPGPALFAAGPTLSGSAEGRPVDGPAPGDPDKPAYTSAIEILIVCTGNTCRSPMAEALLRQRIADRSVDASVSSAGLLSDGHPATGTAVETLASLGLDLSEHRSRRISPDLLASADLVLGMAREHVREAVVMRPDGYGRTFTLKELVRRGGEVGARRADEPLDAWLARAHDGRTPTQQMGSSAADDVADPVGQSAAVYEATARELGALVDQLADLLWQQVTPDRATVAAPA